MLSVWFGHDYKEKYVRFPKGIISRGLKPSDFTDSFICRAVKEIDNVTIDSDGRMWHPVFGAINQSMLSNGVSQLIMLYKFKFVGDITYMGDNCLPFLLEIAQNKDITCVCNRAAIFDRDFICYDIKHNEFIKSAKDFALTALISLNDELQNGRV